MGDDGEWEALLLGTGGAPADDPLMIGSVALRKEFCSVATRHGASDYVDQSLDTLGLQRLDILSLTKSPEDAVKVLNSVHALIETCRAALRSRDDLTTRSSRLQDDNTQLRNTVSRLKEQIIKAERDLGQAEEASRQALMKAKAAQDKLQKMEDDFKRVKFDSHSRETQFLHEKRRLEAETEKLKQKLVRSLQASDKLGGSTIVNEQLLSRPDGKRRTWNSSERADEDLRGAVITKYEDKQQELMQENESLRRSLASMQKELIEVLSHSSAQSLSGLQNLEALEASEPSSPLNASLADPSVALSEGLFDLPYSMSRERIENALKAKMDLVKQRLARIRALETERPPTVPSLSTAASSLSASTVSPPHVPRGVLSDPPAARGDEDGMEVMRQKLAEYKAIIDRQQVLLLEAENAAAASLPDRGTHYGASAASASSGRGIPKDRSFLSDSRLETEYRNLTDRIQMYEEEKRQFDRERERFTQGAVKLGQERAKLQLEKDLIERQKKSAPSSSKDTERLSLSNLSWLESPSSSPKAMRTSIGPNTAKKAGRDMVENLLSPVPSSPSSRLTSTPSASAVDVRQRLFKDVDMEFSRLLRTSSASNL